MTQTPPPEGLVDLDEIRLEAHVARAFERAWQSSRGAPLSPTHLLQAALAGGEPGAFRTLAGLLPWTGTGPVPDVPGGPGLDLRAVPVTDPLERSFAVATDFLRAGERTMWGRDFVTLALLAHDSALDAIARDAGTDIDAVRDQWFRFVRDSGKHRASEEWERWWWAAGVRTPPPTPPTVRLQSSKTVEAVMAGLAAPTSADGVTAFDLARALATGHPQYAGGRLVPRGFDTPAGARRLDPDTWLDSVSARFDPDAVASSRHRVLDTRLLLVGLALVEPALHQRLESLGAWGPLLLEVDDAAAPPGSALGEVLGTVQLRHGYTSDVVDVEDRLGIEGEANALCDVLLDPAVQPPLAVGLFGDWGSGKSFFMDLMRRRVEHLTTHGTYRDQEVRQIRFNAWHYADTSLWASLAVEVFERLVDPEPVDLERRAQWLRDKGDPGRAEREKLLVQLESYTSHKAELDARIAALDAERGAVVARRAQTVAKREQARRDARLTDVVRELARDSKVSTALGGIGELLGLEPAIGELTTLAASLRTAGYFPAIWRMTRHKVLVVALLAVAFVVALATAGLLAGGTPLTTPEAGIPALVAVASVVTAAVGPLRRATRQVGRALAAVEDAVGVVTEVQARLQARRSAQELELDAELEDLDRQVADAGRTLAALDQQIATTRAEAEALTVGRQLYGFLADRAAGYQKHQGLVGMLHRDFRFLDAQLRSLRGTADSDRSTAGGDGLPRIDRVILYIDDLDRCPPAKVLEVLEAVHLLLALELFVVVVGVDPRWLQRSLRHQYRELVTGGDPASDAYLRVMPIEYLEKIFQIPLTLPAMEPAAFGRLIAGLGPAGILDQPSAAEVGAVRHEEIRPEAASGEPAPARTPIRALMEVQAGSSASGAPGNTIDLTRAEVEYAQRLGHLLHTPRAAKRLMNTYRLIRATQHVGSRSRFLGSDGAPGAYQAVLTLLAVAAGYPALADRLLLALEGDHTGITDWSAFLTALDPAAPGRLVPPGLAREPGADRPSPDAIAWDSLHRALVASHGAGGPDAAGQDLEDLAVYRRWGPIAARFSFTL